MTENIKKEDKTRFIRFETTINDFLYLQTAFAAHLHRRDFSFTYEQ